MKSLVCIKQVPDDSVEVRLGRDGRPTVAENTPVVNVFDTYALEMAVRLKEEVGGTVTVITVGDELCKDSLKNCIAVGADAAKLVLCANATEKSSQYIVSLLSDAINLMETEDGEPFDLIFCGKETTDYAGAQIGPMLAEQRKVGLVTGIVGVVDSADCMLIKQQTEIGYNQIRVLRPCVLTVEKPDYEPRYPTIKSKMAARKAIIPTIELNVTDTTPNALQCEKFTEPKQRTAGIKLHGETLEEVVKTAVTMMANANIL